MRRFSAPVSATVMLVVLFALLVTPPPAGLAQTVTPPTLRSPAVGATVAGLSFGWDSVPDAAKYEIEVWELRAGVPVAMVWQAATRFPAITPRDRSAIPQGTLAWKVRVVDAANRRSAWSESTFTYRIDVPSLVSPPNDATFGAERNLAFEWSVADGAQAYEVQVARDSAFDELAWSATTSDTQVVAPLPLGVGFLYWRVRGQAPGSAPGEFSDRRRLTRSVAVPQNLVQPEGATPLFLWDPVLGAVAYNIQVSSRSDFLGTPLWEADTVNTAITPPGTNFGTDTRYWRVRARDAGGFTGAWSTGEPFALTPPGGVITLVLEQPAHGAILANDPTFAWEPVEDAAGYVVEVAQAPDFDPLYDRIQTRYTAYTPFASLVQGDEPRRPTYANGVYYWRVRVLGSEAASEERRFTKTSTLEPHMPIGNPTLAADPRFEWASVPGAHHYRLRVAENAAFEPLYDIVELGATQYVPYAAVANEPDAYANGGYFWRVEALDGEGQTVSASDPAAFTKQAVLDLTSPADGAALPVPPSFVWSPVPGAYGYRLTLRREPGYTEVYDQVDTDATRYTPYGGDSARDWYANGTYRWQVEALDNLGQPLATSETRQLTIGEAAPPTVSPTPTARRTNTATPTTTATPLPGDTPTVTRTPVLPTPTPTAGPPPDSDEPNDSITQATLLEPGTHSSYLSQPRDIDWYKIWIDQPRSRLRVSLIQPPADLDLALLSDPARLDATWSGLGHLEDWGDVAPTGSLASPTGLDDIGPIPDRRAVRDLSVQRGLLPEEVATNAEYQPGWYYLLVQGYNGSTSRHPYSLQLEIEPPSDVRQCTVSLPPPGVVILRWLATDAPETLILTNKLRLDAYYRDNREAVDELIDRLHLLAQHPAVNGMIEPVENVPAIEAAYIAWDADACNPDAANRVTGAIKAHIDELRQQYPSIQQIVIVGNDDIVPFHRVPEEVAIASEAGYLSQIDANAESPFYAALEQSYLLTDSFYVDDNPLAWRGRRLYVPDRPVGRLVEQPVEMSNAVRAFLDADGRITLHSGFAVASQGEVGSTDRLVRSLLDAGVDVESLMGPGWTDTDLRNGLLHAHHDVNILNTAFTHHTASSGPVAGAEALSAEAVAEVGGELTPSLFLSTGSHSGLNVPDRWAAGPDRIDFAQAFSGWGVAVVANTGHGYGSPGTQGYSQRLMADLIAEIVGTSDAAVGAALTRAKQQFFNTTGPAGFSTYHAKAMLEATLFGIPNWRLTVSDLAEPAEAKQVTEEEMEPLGNDLYRREFNLVPKFQQISTGDGAYYAADDGILNRPGRPIQPRFTWSVREPDLSAHGAFLREATYTELPAFNPIIARPVTDGDIVEPPFPFSAWSPARLHAINRIATARDLFEQLVVVPGQFWSTDATAGTGIQRRYDSLTYDVYYSASADWTPPSIWQVVYTRTALGAEIQVDATDAHGIQRIGITYTTGDGTWQTHDLQLISGTVWHMLLPYFDADRLDFMVQAVDGAGNVTLLTDKGRFFRRRPHTFYLVPILR